MSEEVFQGSDGVFRTLEQWCSFVRERAKFADGNELSDQTGSKLRGVMTTFSVSQSKGYGMLRAITELSSELEISDIESKKRKLAEMLTLYSPEQCIADGAEVLSDFFAKFIAQAVEAPQNKDHTEALAEQFQHLATILRRKKAHRNSQRSLLGIYLAEFIEEKQHLPNHPKLLAEFIEDKAYSLQKYTSDLESIPPRTIAEHLSWYALEDICRGNQKG